MAPQNKASVVCEVCRVKIFKYTCPQCKVVYCSLGCYKSHKESSCFTKIAPASTSIEVPNDSVTRTEAVKDGDSLLADPVSLRTLASLKWPYVPEESAFPNPLKRDDPKTLQLPQYEAIATSNSVRKILAEEKSLPELLTSIDRLRGPDREYALQKALGVTPPDIDGQFRSNELSEDVLALRKLAEAIETAVRGGKEGALGLDWGVE